MVNVGIAIGIIMGCLSGAIFINILKTLAGNNIGVKDKVIMFGEITLIATFMFGGSWLDTKLLGIVNINEILESYMNSLLSTFILISLFPLFWYIMRTGNQIKTGRRS